MVTLPHPSKDWSAQRARQRLSVRCILSTICWKLIESHATGRFIIPGLSASVAATFFLPPSPKRFGEQLNIVLSLYMHSVAAIRNGLIASEF